MKKKKLIISILITIISTLLLLVGFFAVSYFSKNKKDNTQSETIEIEKEEEIIQEETVEPLKTVFVNKIEDDYGVPQEVMDLIVEYNNRYYQCMNRLEYVSSDDLFSSVYEAAITEYANKHLIVSRLAYDYNLSITDGYFDIKVKDYEHSGNKYEVEITQDDTLYFSCLDGLETNIYNVSSEFEIVYENNEYKIDELTKVQDYFVMFTEPEPYNVKEIKNLYEKYCKDKYNEVIEELKLRQYAKENPYTSNKSVDYEYDRNAAKEYSYRYITSRNPDYVDYSNGGGNCQNFASQMIYESGIPMDYYGYGDQQWKYYGSEVDESQSQTGRSLSWATVDYFYDYVVANDGYSGMVTDYDGNIYYAEPGDVLQVGFDNYHRHTTVVADVYKGIVLLNSNTVNMCNFPMDAYAYNAKRLIKILGYND